MKLKLFYLDDDDIQIDIMTEYLKLCDIPKSVVFHTNSYKAVKYLQETPIEDLPHVLFIDVFMPIMDGWDILNWLTPLMETHQWFPSIYIVTSSVSNKDKARAKKQAYLKSFLNKPVKLSTLKLILQDEFDNLTHDDR